MTDRSGGQRHVLGMRVTVEAVAVCLAVVALGALVSLAMMTWLERMA